ncbi:hypothetical protein [Limnoglobus roseus]|uniref:hypothetical protein n=1 Tax=Limnoglobus roseus TaxID=2598579 RepID=UPI0011EB26B2|nr:hypothetical protein [Limnoglobus roseus]
MSERRRRHAECLDGRLPTPEQYRQLIDLTADAFTAIRSFCDQPVVVFALADAFHNLPRMAVAPEYSWSWALMYFERLARDHPEVGDWYLTAFDRIMGFDAEPVSLPDPPSH